jgi:hypothetical protein
MNPNQALVAVANPQGNIAHAAGSPSWPSSPANLKAQFAAKVPLIEAVGDGAKIKDLAF